MPERRVVRLARPVYGRPKEKKDGPKWLKFLKSRIALKLAAAAAILLVVSNVFAVESIEVTGVRQSKALETQASVRRQIRHPWQSNLLMVRTGRLEEAMLKADPALRQIEITRRWPSALKVKVNEKAPALIWQNGSQQFILDSDGSLIGYAEGQKLPVIVDLAGLPVKVGDRVVSRTFVQFCVDIAAGLGKRGIKVTRFAVPATTSEVEVSTDKGYVIKFDTARGAEAQLVDLSAVLKTLSKLRKTPAEYIDLRIERKAYYR
jgi:cell division septal protein FtsQ